MRPGLRGCKSRGNMSKKILRKINEPMKEKGTRRNRMN